jgi:hypothetical protein
MAPTPPSKRRKLADVLTAAPNAKRYQFTQKSGPRRGQQFNVVTGKSGLAQRKYASGDTATAETDTGVNVAAQKRDVARRFEGSVRKVKPQGVGFDSSGSAQQQQQQQAQLAAQETAAKYQKKATNQTALARQQLSSTLRKPRRKPTPFGGRIR